MLLLTRSKTVSQSTKEIYTFLFFSRLLLHNTRNAAIPSWVTLPLLKPYWFGFLVTFRFILCNHLSYQSTTTTIILRPFVWDYPGEPVPEETFTHPQSWSSSNLYQLLQSTTIHSILSVQIMCLAVFLHKLSPCPFWSTSWSGALHLIFHTFLHQSVSSFRNTCAYHHNLFYCSIKIISSTNPASWLP